MKNLFAPLNSPYYLYAPAYADGSTEARVLHHLCHALNLAGEEAYVTGPGSAGLRTPQLAQAQVTAHLQAGRQPIVVYPDRTPGNPLGAGSVVRLLLTPGARYDVGEMPVAWHPERASLSVPHLAVPLADDGGYAREGAAFERQLQDFISTTQRRFGRASREATAAPQAAVPTPVRPAPAPATTAAAAPIPAPRPVATAPAAPAGAARPLASAQLMRGNLARPLARPTATDAAAVVPAAAPASLTPQSAQAQASPVPAAAPSHSAAPAAASSALAGLSGFKTRPRALASAAPSGGPIAVPAALKRKKRLVVYSVESTWSPCPQIRLIRPFAHLQDDWELVWGIQNGQLQAEYLDSADLIVLHRFTPGLMSIDTLKSVFASRVPILYESDDLLNDIPHDHPEAQQGASWKEGIEYAIRHARAVVVSTEFLATRYRALNPSVYVLPNFIDFDLFYRPVPSGGDGERINIGLLGSSIQPSNFALVDDALRALVERYGERLHIDFVGWECPKGWSDHPQATFHSFVHQYVDYAAQLKQWNWDIALIPLASDEYNACKSYVKWLDYSAAGIASVFSDVSVYNEVVEHERTGLLMPPSSAAWLEAVTMLIESPDRRHALATAGQQAVRENFDLRDKAALYNDTYGRLAQAF